MHANRWLLAVLLSVLATVLVACGQEAVEAGHEPPVILEPVDDDSEVTRIRLTARAAERLAVETSPVEAFGSGLMAVPYGAIFYGNDGETWLYANPEPLVFVREHIVVDRIEGEQAVLSEGPEVGTLVATVAVAELFGAETGVGGSGH